jgi:phage baseplate assembly protein W
MSTAPASVAFPLAVDRHGATELTPQLAAAAEQLIEQLLFTNPGERLNRPTLGAGAIELVFDSLTDELRTATQHQIMSGLQQWVGDVIRVTAVTAASVESTLQVDVTYVLAGVQTRTARFTR